MPGRTIRDPETPQLPPLPQAATATPIRAGFDSLSFSASTRSRRLLLPLDRFSSPDGTFIRQKKLPRLPSRSAPWVLRLEYTHVPTGHRLFVFLDRTVQAVPPVYCRLTAAPGRLFSLREAMALSSLIGKRLGLFSMQVSQIELTADFPVTPLQFEQLGRWLRVPWGKGPIRVGTTGPRSFYWGTRRSRRVTKLYWKTEAGASVARLEHTYRSEALRSIGVTEPQDLLTVDWAAVAARRAWFVQVDPRGSRRTRDARLQARSMVLTMGFGPWLAGKPQRYRAWLSTKLVPLPIQENLEAAFRRLSEGS